MGICGTGMASLAGMLKEKGFQVTGSDHNIYPPMSDFLEALSIPVLKDYSPCNLFPAPDLVIVGNVITKENPEAVELSSAGIHYLSFPQALRHFALKDKRSLVISGTHGKTTTSSLVAWILEEGGMDPGFMIGGIPYNFRKNFKSGHGPYFVIEGDEYDTAFFDKGPKFMHYRPWATILTSIEFDHADIYRDLDHVVENFRKLVDLIPADGVLIANADEPLIRQEIERAKCKVITYALSHEADWTVDGVSIEKDYTHLTIIRSVNPQAKHAGEYFTLQTPLYGRHNISNLLSALVLADYLGLSPSAFYRAVRTFKGIRRRQEIIGEKKGILILDDFAHHPTAVKETIAAVSKKYKNRRLIAVFEPRSNSSRRNVFQSRYALSFDNADRVMIPEPSMMEKIPSNERFSSQQLVRDLKEKGFNASYFQNTDQLLEALLSEARKDDVILIMSNGAFDDLPRRLLERL